MKTRSKKLLFLFFAIVFLIITPLVLLYSQGYSFNLEKFNFIKTGNLYLVSYPSEAKVSLNGKTFKIDPLENFLFYKKLLNLTRRKSITPTLVDHLLPDEYLIRVEKDGYFPWQRKDFVEPEKTKIFRDILLFKKVPEIKMIAELPDKNNYYVFDKKIAFFDKSKKNIEIINIIDGQKNEISVSKEMKSLKWLSEQKIIATLKDSRHLIIDLTKQTFINLEDTFKKNLVLKNLKNYSLLPSFLFSNDSKNIYKIGLENKKIEVIYSLDKKDKSSINDFWLNNNNLYYLKNNGDQNILENYNLEIKKFVFQINIPVNKYKFLENKGVINNFAFLKNNNNLIIIDTDEIDPEKNIILNETVKNILFLGNGLIYHSDYEIAYFDLISGKKEIIDRNSQPILKIFYHPRGYYLFIIFEDKIKILELSQEQANIIEYSFKNISEILPGKNSNSINLIGEIDKKFGIFELKIHYCRFSFSASN